MHRFAYGRRELRVTCGFDLCKLAHRVTNSESEQLLLSWSLYMRQLASYDQCWHGSDIWATALRRIARSQRPYKDLCRSPEWCMTAFISARLM